MSHELRSGTNTRISKRWLVVAWVVLFAICVLNLIIYVIGTVAKTRYYANITYYRANTF
jgi:hypothetical protein